MKTSVSTNSAAAGGDNHEDTKNTKRSSKGPLITRHGHRPPLSCPGVLRVFVVKRIRIKWLSILRKNTLPTKLGLGSPYSVCADCNARDGSRSAAIGSGDVHLPATCCFPARLTQGRERDHRKELMSSCKRIGILTAGGDCPGLNAVIRGAVKSANRHGYEVIGFLKGYEGLVDPVSFIPLTHQNTNGILSQ